MTKLVRNSLVKNLDTYVAEHKAQLQAYIDSDVAVLNPSLEDGKQPTPTMGAFQALSVERKVIHGSEFDVYICSDNRVKIEYLQYNVVVTLNAHQESLCAYVDTKEGILRKCFLGDLGRKDNGEVCFIPTRLFGRMSGNEKGQHYLDNIKHLWALVLDEDTSFINHLMMYMFAEYQI